VTGFQLLPPLAEDDYDSLREDIRAHGVLQAIYVDENGVILDGHHRQQIATELGIDCPKRVVEGLRNDTSKRTYALTVNTNRRHLTADQRRHLTETSLREDPQLTDREHARRIGVSPSSVGSARQRLQDSGQLAPADRIDVRGHRHPAPVAPDPEPEVPSVQLDSNNGDEAAASGIPDIPASVPATAPTEADEAELECDPLPLPELADPTARTNGNPAVETSAINEESARSSSHTFAASLAQLWMILDPNPVGWLTTYYRPGTYPQRDLPRVGAAFTVDGLRTLADHLNDIADHIESKGATL
jgi:ParB-like chromosome segregation protein Spo0J